MAASGTSLLMSELDLVSKLSGNAGISWKLTGLDGASFSDIEVSLSLSRWEFPNLFRKSPGEFPTSFILRDNLHLSVTYELQDWPQKRWKTKVYYQARSIQVRKSPAKGMVLTCGCHGGVLSLDGAPSGVR